MPAPRQPRDVPGRNIGSPRDFEWLVGPDAAAWLNLAAAEDTASVGLTARLRRDLSAERAHLVLEQATLRRRAREKFAAAEKMFFTPLGLQQSTDEAIADYKAARFGERMAEKRRDAASTPAGRPPSGDLVADFCCGIGGDLMALSASRADCRRRSRSSCCAFG